MSRMGKTERLRLQELEARQVRAHAAAHGWFGVPTPAGSFTSQLSEQDRGRLRLIIRRVQLRWMPAELLTNSECDRLIDAWGPEVAAAVCRDGRTAGFCE